MNPTQSIPENLFSGVLSCQSAVVAGRGARGRISGDSKKRSLRDSEKQTRQRENGGSGDSTAPLSVYR